MRIAHVLHPVHVTDAQWVLIEPHLAQARDTCRRELLNAILYVLTTGCQWRQLPKDLPPKSTVHDYWVEWQCDGTLLRINHALYVQARELAGKEASPTTTIVDSQSVKGAEKGGRAAIPLATTRQRKSKARSGMRPSTHWA